MTEAEVLHKMSGFFTVNRAVKIIAYADKQLGASTSITSLIGKASNMDMDGMFVICMNS